MPIIIVKILEGREPEKIEGLIRDLTDTASRSLEVSPDTVRVLIEEVPKTHWGIAGKSALARGK